MKNLTEKDMLQEKNMRGQSLKKCAWSPFTRKKWNFLLQRVALNATLLQDA